MSCEVWNELVSHGANLLREGSPERSRAERHFTGCPECAERAFLLDPSWALRRSDRSEKPSFGETEIACLKRSVLEASRIREVEGSVRSRRRGMRGAIAAALFVVAVIGGFLLRTVGSFGEATGPEPAEIGADAIAPSRLGEFLPASGSRVYPSLPTVGSLAPAAARVYELGQEDFALVMVVHETLDL